jgi:ubiquinone/menaquinone biosynthesis C-methylase UbiE
LAGLPELSEGAQVLDLGCGPGGWVLDVAFQRPDIEVAGIDISQIMVNYANARAYSQKITTTSFGVMDITRHPLDFSDASFDFVNARFLFGVLKREGWLSFLAECNRLLRPGGILRLTEVDTMGDTLSPSLARLNELAMQLFWKAGYGFSPNGHSFAMLPGFFRLLKQVGFSERHMTSSVIDSSADSPNWANCSHNTQIIFQQMKPLFIHYGLLGSEAFDLLYEQAMNDIYADEDFTASGDLKNIWVKKNG